MMENNEKMQAVSQLIYELEKGRVSGEEMGWLTLEQVEAELMTFDEG